MNAWAAHGETAFIFEILELVLDAALLIARKQVWIEKLDTYRQGYNSKPNAESLLGMKRSDESKRRMSITGKLCMTPNLRARPAIAPCSQ